MNTEQRRRLPLILVLLGFVFAAMLDVACPRHAEAGIVPSNEGSYWGVNITPHPDNVVLEVLTICYNGTKMTFRAVDSHPLDPADDRVLVRRQEPLPHQSDCRVSFDVMRNDKHDGDPRNNKYGEGGSITWREP